MNIKISREAAKWYKDELDLISGAHLRFFVRYGGHSIQSGFSLGITPEPPTQLGTSTKVNGVTFFVEENDLWFFDGHDLIITYNEKIGEPEFLYEKPQ